MEISLTKGVNYQHISSLCLFPCENQPLWLTTTKTSPDRLWYKCAKSSCLPWGCLVQRAIFCDKDTLYSTLLQCNMLCGKTCFHFMQSFLAPTKCCKLCLFQPWNDTLSNFLGFRNVTFKLNQKQLKPPTESDREISQRSAILQWFDCVEKVVKLPCNVMLNVLNIKCDSIHSVLWAVVLPVVSRSWLVNTEEYQRSKNVPLFIAVLVLFSTVPNNSVKLVTTVYLIIITSWQWIHCNRCLSFNFNITRLWTLHLCCTRLTHTWLLYT